MPSSFSTTTWIKPRWLDYVDSFITNVAVHLKFSRKKKRSSMVRLVCCASSGVAYNVGFIKGLHVLWRVFWFFFCLVCVSGGVCVLFSVCVGVFVCLCVFFCVCVCVFVCVCVCVMCVCVCVCVCVCDVCV